MNTIPKEYSNDIHKSIRYLINNEFIYYLDILKKLIIINEKENENNIKIDNKNNNNVINMRKYDIIYPNVNYTNLNINTNINTNINNIIEIYKIKNNNIFNYLSSDKYLYNNNELILDEKNYI